MPHEHLGPGGEASFVSVPPGSASSAPPTFAADRPHPPATANHPPPHGTPASHSPSPPRLGETFFGSALEPSLRQACGARLSAVSWFRADWQRGGALTGYATYTGDAGHAHPAVVKLPVPPAERHWLVRLQHHDHVTPRVFDHGESLGGYDMAWVVMERLPHGPLGSAWGGKEFDLTLDAACRFYLAAREVPVTEAPPHRDWPAILHQSRQNVHRNHMTEERRWSHALKHAVKVLPEWLGIWDSRPVDQWCHGDLHLGNAMTRAAPPDGPALLFDFAQTHAGHWVEDAVYFEHLFWARRQRLGDRKLCRQLAQQRKKLGLPVEQDWPRYAAVRRGLVAMSTPAMLNLDGNPHHVHAALEVLEGELGGQA